MKKWKKIFLLHCFTYSLLVGCSLASRAIKNNHPHFFYVFVVGFGLAAIATIVSWKKWKGCPLTAIERQLRAAEGDESYEGSCSSYYFHMVTGIAVPDFVFTSMQLIFFARPFYVWLT